VRRSVGLSQREAGRCPLCDVTIPLRDAMDRDNAEWLRQITADASQRDGALADLREILLRGVRRSIADRSKVDESFLEDVVQDSLLRILDRLSQFEGRSRFITWAMSITLRVAMTELRRRRWRDESLNELVGEDAFVPERAVDSSPRPDEQTEREDILEALRRIITTDLTEKQRTALVAELRGMALAEIARQMGSNRNAVYKLTYDARIRVKDGLEAAGYEADDVRAALQR